MTVGDLVKIEAHPVAAFSPRTFEDAWRMATAMAKGGLFGATTPEQAFSLMMIADAEGCHPVAAARDYHIIDGKPSLKADAMLARYQKAGGRVKWIKREDEIVSAEFINSASDAVTITWDKARATKAGLWGKGNYTKFPQQMLAARVISEGVRASSPAVISGFYTPEEVIDFGPAPAPPPASAEAASQDAGQHEEPETPPVTAGLRLNPNDPVEQDDGLGSGLNPNQAKKEGLWEACTEEMSTFSTRPDLSDWMETSKGDPESSFARMPRSWRARFTLDEYYPLLNSLPERRG